MTIMAALTPHTGSPVSAVGAAGELLIQTRVELPGLADPPEGPARRAATASRDLCPETGRMRLGYDRARTLIKQYTGLNLHQLRHSAATHLGEAGEDATVIMAKTHHRSIRTLARYTRPGLAAVTKATERLDPPRRRS